MVGRKAKLAEAQRAEIANRVQEGDALEAKVRTKFLLIADELKTKTEGTSLWNVFTTQLLLPLIAELGARTYELVTGQDLLISNSSTYRNFLTAFPDDDRGKISILLDRFIDPSDIEIRSYILRHLHARFLIDALQLSNKNLSSLRSRISERIDITVFADTNFLFSLLDLHDNPANEAVQALQKITQEMTSNVTLKLYVLPITIDEARHTLSNYEQQLAGVDLSAHLGKAAESRYSDLSGIAAKFVKASQKTKWRLSPKEYFSPYINNLLPIARSKGIEIFNEDTSYLKTDLEVVDDLLNRLDYEKRKFPERAKSYETIEHDVVLWHFAKRKRPPTLESPLDAQFWVATVDFRYLGFDAFKRRHEHQQNTIAVCIHPSILVQMLQFWIPRNSEFETALLNSLRPMLPRSFDPSAEKITLAILRAISRFENIDDIDEGTIASVLMDRAIRQRMANSQNLGEQVDIVKEALIIEAETTKTRNTKEREALAESLKIRENEVEKLTLALKEAEEGKAKTLADSIAKIEEERAASRILHDRLLRLEEQELHRKEKDKVRLIRTRLLFYCLTLVLATLAIVGFLSWQFFILPLPWIAEILALAGLTWFIEAQGKKRPEIVTWKIFLAFSKFSGFIKAGLGLLGTTLLGPYLYDVMKNRIDFLHLLK